MGKNEQHTRLYVFESIVKKYSILMLTNIIFKKGYEE